MKKTTSSGYLVYKRNGSDEPIRITLISADRIGLGNIVCLEVLGFLKKDGETIYHRFFCILESEKEESVGRWLVTNQDESVYDEFEGDILDFHFEYHLEK